MSMKNLKEFKALILRYESVTEEEIKKECLKHSDQAVVHYGVLTRLTGFGIVTACTLCKAVNGLCSLCTWAFTIEVDTSMLHKHLACSYRDNGSTYRDIASAETPEELKRAYKERAKHMRKVLEGLI